MEGAQLVRNNNIDRKSSIENEPRTLNFDQIERAREEASHVMSTRTTEEATRIFKKGLESVVRGVEEKNQDRMILIDPTQELAHSEETLPLRVEQQPRNIVSAPF